MASEATKMVVKGNMHMDTRVLLISNLRSYDLRGCLWATMASEAAMASGAVGGNIHMDTRVIKVADFKSEVK